MEILSYKSLTVGTEINLVFPVFESKMHGAWRATQDVSGTITVHYLDGSTESRTATPPVELASFDNGFSVVSYVQAGRHV